MLDYNLNVSYIIFNGMIATLYLRPSHTLNDVLSAKAYIRKKYNNVHMTFRPSVSIHKFDIT